MKFYDFTAKNIFGEDVSMEEYRNKVVLIVNTASKCGYTPQYKDLEQLYREYKDKGLEILGFPCNQFDNQEPGTNEEVYQFCQQNYGVTFTMFEKIDVNGDNAHPIYKFLTSQPGNLGGEIKWNFTKFLTDKEGNVVKRYESAVLPSEIKDDINRLLNSN